MLPDLLAKVRLRRRDCSITDLLRFISVAGVRGPHDVRDRGEVTRAFIQHRMTNVHMIEEHMRRTVKAAVDDTVREPDLVATNVSLDAPHETKIFSKDRGLPHLSFRPEDAAVALPALAIADEPRGDRAHSPVQRMSHNVFAGVVVRVGRSFLGTKNVIETAGQQEPGERSRPRQSLLPLVFVQGRMPKSTRRMPSDGLPLEIAIRDVERTIDENGEAQPRTRAKLQHTNIALHAIAERHEPHAGELRKRAATLGDLPASQRPTK